MIAAYFDERWLDRRLEGSFKPCLQVSELFRPT